MTQVIQERPALYGNCYGEKAKMYLDLKIMTQPTIAAFQGLLFGITYTIIHKTISDLEILFSRKCKHESRRGLWTDQIIFIVMVKHTGETRIMNRVILGQYIDVN